MNRQECLYLFDKYVADLPEKPNLPEIISFDEKFLNRGIAENGYVFVIVDWKNVEIIDLINSRHIDKLSYYFSKIDYKKSLNVKYITMDMYDTYLKIAKIYFSHATIVVDSFHVLQNLNRAFDKARNKFIRKYDNGAESLEDNDINYYLLKKGARLLTKIEGNLSMKPKYNRKLHYHISDRSFVSLILKIDPEIEKAYRLVQDYLEFNYKNNYQNAKLEIDEIITKFENSKINSFVEFSRTLNTWKEYILNSFTTIQDENKKCNRRLSEGPIEGINSFIEKIYKNANGFSSFELFKKITIFKINKNLAYKFK